MIKEGEMQMDQLVKVNPDTRKVSARDLYEALEIKERFSLWFSRFEDMFNFGEDYTGVGKPTEVQNNGGIQMVELQDYEMSAEMAKHICMMCKTEKGKQCRTYFIDLEKAWNTPEQIMARALKMAEQTISKLSNEKTELETTVLELKPKADYMDRILKNPGLVTITQIAKDYGMSGQAMNDILHNLKVQYKQSEQWLLYSKYQDCGYTHSETIDIERTDGRKDVKMNTKWTQKGRLFLYQQLKDNGYHPTIEKIVA